MKRILCLILTLMMIAVSILAVSAEITLPDNLSIAPGADETMLNFIWYTEEEEGGGGVIYAKTDDLTNGEMPEDAQYAEGVMELANDADMLYSVRATLTGLEPETEYTYQLSVNGNISRTGHFTTDAKDDFSFAFLGDPQIGSTNDGLGIEEDSVNWANTLNLLATDPTFSDIAFAVSAGDQTDDGSSEYQYEKYLDHEFMSYMPFVHAIGNHDNRSPLHSYHFNMPNHSEEYGVTVAGNDSYFVYNNTLFLVLNSNSFDFESHREFVSKAIEANPDVTWRIAIFHHSLFPAAKHVGDSDTNKVKAGMIPLLEEFDIDAVLTGHDHVYCRTYMMDGETPMTDLSLYDDDSYGSVTDPTGILYITANSSSGSKTYDISLTENEKYSCVANQEHVPNAAKVSVTDTSFTITTYRTTDMAVVDTFTINKTTAEPMAFEDVKESHWYYDAVEYVYGKGMMSGMSETKFGPNVTTNRAMLVSVLWRLEGCPEGYTHDFADVRPSHYFDKAVAWAASNGIAYGKSETRYAPNDTLTREQLAAILYRYAEYKEMDTAAAGNLSVFTDITKLDSYAVDAMKWAYGKGIITGMKESVLDPNGSATRAQLASILMRFLG